MENNFKHTPGPWRYEKDSQMVFANSMRNKDGGEFLLTDVRGWGHLQYLPNGEEVQDSNGKLIAAAPELLEALQMLVEKCLHTDGYSQKIDELFQAQQAIKKATE